MSRTDQAPTPPTRAPRGSSDWLGRAWTAVVLIPVFFVIAFAVGEGGYALLGYKPENADAPVWVDLVVGVATIAVVLSPCVAAVVYGRRANESGDRRGRVPLVIGAIAGVGAVALTVVSEVGDLLAGR